LNHSLAVGLNEPRPTALSFAMRPKGTRCAHFEFFGL
jgi:hypothetical protein